MARKPKNYKAPVAQEPSKAQSSPNPAPTTEELIEDLKTDPAPGPTQIQAPEPEATETSPLPLQPPQKEPESPTANPTETPTLTDTTAKTETTESSTDNPPKDLGYERPPSEPLDVPEAALASDDQAPEPEATTPQSPSDIEKKFLRLKRTIMTRWTVSNISSVMGALDRAGIISAPHTWPTAKSNTVAKIIKNRLQHELYLRNLWIQIVYQLDGRDGKGSHLGNPMAEAKMATGLALIDFLNEECSRND